MHAPWFLDVLGVEPGVDERGIRRAYAARLKTIDPATHAEEFARLRKAYEEARAWVGRSVSGEPEEPREEHHAQEALPRVPDPREEAGQAIAVLAHALAAETETPAKVLLHRVTEALRYRHVDGLAYFEAFLPQAMQQQHLTRRIELFAAAAHAFRWNEVGHRGALGESTAWIDEVCAREAAWHALPVPLRDRLAIGIATAETSPEALPPKVVAAWPAVEGVDARLGEYLRLRLTDSVRVAWVSQFTALPGRRQQKLRRAEQRRQAPPSRWRAYVDQAFRGYWGRFFFLCLGVRVVLAILKQFGVIR